MEVDDQNPVVHPNICMDNRGLQELNQQLMCTDRDGMKELPQIGRSDTCYSRILEAMQPYQRVHFKFLLGDHQNLPTLDLIKEALTLTGNYELLLKELGIRKKEADAKYLPEKYDFSLEVDLLRKRLFAVAENLCPVESQQLVLQFEESFGKLSQQPESMELEHHFDRWIRKGKNEVVKVLEEVLLNMKKLDLLRKITYEEKASDADLYHIDPHNVGRCIIINQKVYKKGDNSNPDSRLGTDLDCARVQETFTALGYDVVILQDLNLARMKPVLQEESSRIPENCSSLVVVILAHGGKDVIYCVDGLEYPIARIQDFFNPSNCPNLKNKFKIFFIQACQGDTSLMATTPISTLSSELAKVDSDHGAGTSSARRDIDVQDFFIYSSAVPGTTSLRHPIHGSFFIRALCSSLPQFPKQSKSLSEVCRNCQRIVIKVNEDIGGVRCAMVPASTSTLSKELIFEVRPDGYKKAVELRLKRMLTTMIFEKMITKYVLAKRAR